jgi:hypothetical protein
MKNNICFYEKHVKDKELLFVKNAKFLSFTASYTYSYHRILNYQSVFGRIVILLMKKLPNIFLIVTDLIKALLDNSFVNTFP